MSNGIAPVSNPIKYPKAKSVMMLAKQVQGMTEIGNDICRQCQPKIYKINASCHMVRMKSHFIAIVEQ